MTAWAHSPAYGQAIALGPTQAAVYRFVWGMTEHGRRPTFTLAAIAKATGKPVSSVHDALGRLRALGLIGCAARMGRTGGHRLWRVVSRSVGGALDTARHRLAVARLIKRWALSVPTERDREAIPPATLWREPPASSANSGADDSPEVPSEPSRSFRELIGLHHRLPWEADSEEGRSECGRAYAEGVGS
jgi:hypothetical protein